MQLSLGDLIADLSGSAAEDAQVRSLSNEARQWHAKGNKAMAQGAYQQAMRIWQQQGSDPALGSELEYTRQIISGDQSANADYKSGLELVARGKVNSRPEDDSFLAQFGTQPDGSRGGFWEGLSEGVGNLRAGRWFAGMNPAEAVSSLTGVSPNVARIGFAIVGVGVAGYALSQANKLMGFFKKRSP